MDKEKKIELEAWWPSVKELKSASKAIGKTAVMIWQVAPLSLLFSMATLTLIQSILPALKLYLMKFVIDDALKISKMESRDIDAILLWLIALVCVIILIAITPPIALALQSILGDKMKGYIATLTMDVVDRLPDLAHFENPKFHDQLQQIQRIQPNTADVIIFGFDTCKYILQIVFIAMFLSTLDFVFTGFFFLTIIPYALVNYIFTNRAGIAIQLQAPEARKLDYYRNQMLSYEAAKDVKSLGLYCFFSFLYDKTFKKITTTLWNVRFREFLWLSLCTVVGSVGLYAVYSRLVHQAIEGLLTIGSLVAYLTAMIQLWMYSNECMFGVALLFQRGRFLSHLFALLQVKPAIKIISNQKMRPFPDFIERVDFKEVSFRYPRTERLILNQVSFSINFNESVSLVGRNGAGKTTIVKLLVRLYDPHSGQILINGIPISYFDLDELRKNIGIVFQDYNRYQLTIEENIGLGNLNPIKNKIKEAADQAGADFIEKLPNKFATLLGKQFEGGTELSIGQWQKLAIARAFFRDARILILDEPTAALDVQSEYETYLHFRDLTKNKVTLIISHRLSTAHVVDRIIVLEEGRIVEEGNHSSLINLQGVYSDLYNMQAKQYNWKKSKDEPADQSD